MKENKSFIFSPAEILLPKFSHDSAQMSKWAVIACDQFTSERAYWDECESYIGDSPSTYNYILPEAYLGSEKEQIQNEKIKEHMDSFDKDSMSETNGFIYVERTLPNGKIRHGLVGKIDLESYDYTDGSNSPVRATEATVVDRIPSRCKVRAAAKIELPHILVLIGDKNGIFKEITKNKLKYKVAYDFDLMMGGGHIKGYEITGENLEPVMKKIAEYESSAKGVVYAVGDGNHSLAAAKTHWENIKNKTGATDHPARYVLCEITSVSDRSLEFEPIYRIMTGCDVDDVMRELSGITIPAAGYNDAQNIKVIAEGKTKLLTFSIPSHALTVGTLQNFIDNYIRTHSGVSCDYIHGEDSVKKLTSNKGCIGFIMDVMDKKKLFPYVSRSGALPRKTFSMGEAESKRYYLEARVIVE